MKFSFNPAELETDSQVYPFSEDSELMLETLLNELHTLQKPESDRDLSNRDIDVWEVGCGNGWLSMECALRNYRCLATDISDIALRLLMHNIRKLRISNLMFFRADLLSGIKSNVVPKYIVFNPPYLPTQERERIKDSLEEALDGGEHGTSQILRFLKEFYSFASKGSTGLLLISSMNYDDPELSYSLKPYTVRKAGFKDLGLEYLEVLRLEI